MSKYVVVINELHVRGSQIAPKSYLDSIDDGDLHDFDDWIDMDGPIMLGIFDAESEEQITSKIAKEYNLDERLLCATAITD